MALSRFALVAFAGVLLGLLARAWLATLRPRVAVQSGDGDARRADRSDVGRCARTPRARDRGRERAGHSRERTRMSTLAGIVVAIDGVIVLPEHAKVSVLDRGFLYGDAVFE